jgi:ELWxxDGT repeat protein
MKYIYILLLLCVTRVNTNAQTFNLVSDINPTGDSNPFDFASFNGLVYFSASPSLNNNNLYSTNGTMQGTSQIPFLNSNDIPYSPNNITNFNNKLVFSAYDYTGDNEIWISDGTASGTQVLKNINSAGSSNPANFLIFGNLLLFTATDNLNGYALWATDGTTSGTQIIKAIGTIGYNQANYFLYGSMLLFTNNGPNGGSLWKTDGTTSGTQMLQPITSLGFVELNNKVYFAGNDSIHGNEFWQTDGTVNGTVLVKDINPTGSSNPYHLTVNNGKIYFSAANRVDTNTYYANTELWASDGTNAGTYLVKEIWPDTTKGSNPGFLNLYNGLIYFIAYDGISMGLWETDGTNIGTRLIKELNTNTSYDLPFCNYNGKLFFSVSIDTALLPGQLWQSDGSATNTVNVKSLGIVPPQFYVIYNNNMYMTADQGTNSSPDLRLWQSNGTDSGTEVIAPTISPNNNPLGITYEFFQMNNSLFFRASFNNAGNELWTLTTQSTGIKSSELISVSVYPNPANDKLFLDAKGAIVTEINIYSVTGGVAIQKKLPTNFIDITSLSEGLYLAEIKAEGVTIIKKFVKM